MVRLQEIASGSSLSNSAENSGNVLLVFEHIFSGVKINVFFFFFLALFRFRARDACQAREPVENGEEEELYREIRCCSSAWGSAL